MLRRHKIVFTRNYAGTWMKMPYEKIRIWPHSHPQTKLPSIANFGGRFVHTPSNRNPLQYLTLILDNYKTRRNHSVYIVGHPRWRDRGNSTMEIAWEFLIEMDRGTRGNPGSLVVVIPRSSVTSRSIRQPYCSKQKTVIV